MKKFFLVISIIFTFLIPHSAKAQTVFIPDPYFKADLVANPSINTNMDSEIQVSEATAFTGTFIINNINITDVTGLESFTNMTEFYVWDFNPSFLNFGYHPNLKRIQIDAIVTLFSINVSSCVALEEFHWSGSSTLMSTLNLSNLTNLRTVYCQDCNLTDINLFNCPSLRDLVCHFNQLTSLDLSGNPLLRELDCHNNQLSSLDLSNNNSLTELNCSDNPLTQLDVSNNPNLNYLECSNTQINNLNISHNPDLRALECSNNAIYSLDISNNSLLFRLYINGNNLSALDCSNHSEIRDINCSNNQLVFLNMQNDSNMIVWNFNALNNPNLTCIQVDDTAWSNANWTNIDPQTSFSTDCGYANIIRGRIVIDDNCAINGSETGIDNMLMKTQANNFTLTGSSGEFTLLVDSGQFQVYPVLNNPLLSFICPVPNYHLINFDTVSQDTSNINFYIDTIGCPMLSIDISSTTRRICFNNHTYVNFCNDGYADADSVFVYLEYSDSMYIVSANYPYTIDSLGNYVFSIGTLSPGDCGTIHITDFVSCNVGILGSDLCIKASILPHNDCIDRIDSIAYNLWDKSSIAVEGLCVGDSIVKFSIINTGDAGIGDMQVPSEYRLYADNMLVFTSSFQINGQDTLEILIQANGQTMRLEADQHPMHPGNSHPQDVVVGCGNNGLPLVPGIVNNMPLNDIDQDVEIDCMIATSSYDPNDKNVSPTGITSNRYVPKNTLIDYVIRFQNTGNDTAFNVVVIDTLSEYLDLSTIQWGASSHEYTYDVSGQVRPVLEFSFNNINLPDSTTDEPNSHGFIKFKVALNSSVPNGALVRNIGYIYFDYNPAIVTNDAWITILDTVLTGSSITFLMDEEHNDSITICDGDSVYWCGDYYSLPGTYTSEYLNVFGCDSILHMNLTVNPTYHQSTAITICGNDSLFWEGSFYYEDSTCFVNYPTINGCDSIMQLDLVVNPVYRFDTVYSICENDSLFWEGNFYSEDSTYFVNYPTINGCDSIMQLDLVVNPVYHFDTVYSICENDSLFWEGSYYSEDSTYFVNYPTINGCDSIMQLDLVVNPHYHYNTVYSICENDSLFWEGSYYSEDSTYFVNYPTINGCDSLLELNLTVIPNPTNISINGLSAVILYQSEIYYALNNSLLYTWSVEKGTILQQIANNVIQVQWDSIGLGHIYVIAEDQNGCMSDTTILDVVIGTNGLEDISNNNGLLIYPNPTNNEIIIETKGFIEVELYNNLGQIVLKSNKNKINLQKFSKGIYFAKVLTTEGIKSTIVIKE